ncbi:diacylglucosamine hydrolase like [Desulfocucumis palustris]|uniref:Epoxyqueuosine reductase QueH n=1 Tax=Desulfocucumis palustris TaxID=1898651 RepID=A0A2L2XGG5_9FIRM|nr:epoxyqueuosine reductase QueH [Desulfocucumis palustris]GBF35328.1 diacylglucosamine hydrolase like [Desulfocucumis palustris]
MKLLLHTCCGPCTIYPLDKIREEAMDVTGYYYNPNIHPYSEWLKRRETLENYAREKDFRLIVDEDYPLEEFLRSVVHRESVRCSYCYAMRLRRAAKVARKGKFDCFSSTLLVSPFQKHDLIKEIGEAVAKETGIPFYYADFRPGYKEAASRSRELGMYRQQYCGCIYSEKERYYKKPGK